MVRMAKKVKVKKTATRKESKPVTQASTPTTDTTTVEAPVKTRKPRAPLKEPVTNAEFRVRAGRVQQKIINIEANYDKALGTAKARIDEKYKAKVKDEISGLKQEVIDLLVIPEFAVDDVLADLVENEGFVEITDETKAAE